MYLSLQASEISSLKAELNMLRRKDVPPLPAMVPVLSYNQNERTYLYLLSASVGYSNLIFFIFLFLICSVITPIDMN